MINDTYLELALEFKKNRDDKTFTKLYSKMKPCLYHYILDFVKDKDIAKDVLSDTFTKVFTQIEKYDPEKGQITTWAFRIAKNDCLSHIKKNKRKTSIEKYFQNGSAPTTSDGFLSGVQYEYDEIKTEEDYWDEHNEVQSKYKLALDSVKNLSPLYRDIIYDRIINGMDYKSIMYKHDAQFVKYEQQYEAGKVSERFYNKEYKRALQRVKNRIKRGREMLGAMVNEKYQEECI